jgi:hypothetical protein
MKQFIQDPIVTLKIDGVVSELHPELTKDQITEVAHFVFHRMNVIPLYDQAKELIEEYIEEELGINS